MADVTQALVEAVHATRPDMRALADALHEAQAAGAPEVPPPADDGTIEQFLNAFETLLAEALEGGHEQRELVLDSAVPALVADGQSALEMLEDHVAFFVAYAPLLLGRLPEDLRAEGTRWLSQFFSGYARDVTERALEAERSSG